MVSIIKFGSATQVDLSAGRHIVYTYTDIEKYLENVTSFITEGIEKNQIVIYIDHSERLDMILQNHQGNIMLSVKDMADYLHIYVIDNGPGISKEIIDRVCDPFITTKARNHSLGVRQRG